MATSSELRQSQPISSLLGSNKLPFPLVVAASLVGVSRAVSRQASGRANRNRQQPRFEANGEGRGNAADTPTEIPARGWMDVAWRVYGSIQKDRVMLVAAGVTYYALLALFPATAALVSLYGLFADASNINGHLSMLSGFLPEGALQFIGDQVKRIVDQGQRTLSLTFLGTLALSLWSANAATKAVFDALNIIYGEREKRSFVAFTLQALAFTAGGIMLALLALAGIVAVPVALNLLGIPGQSGAALLTLLRWPVLFLVILGGLACLYRWGPSRTKPEWRWVTWGSGLAAAVWLVGSLLLSWYVANFGNYNATYGSLGGVIAFMIWLWLSTMVVLVGGEINAELEHQTARDTTEGVVKPMGVRGARMADEVAARRT